MIIWDVEWDWSTALCAASVDTGRSVRDLAAAGVKLFVAAEDGVRIWNWCGGGGDYDVLPTGPTEALVALDGVRLVAGGDDLAVWDLVTGERLSSWEVSQSSLKRTKLDTLERKLMNIHPTVNSGLVGSVWCRFA